MTTPNILAVTSYICGLNYVTPAVANTANNLLFNNSGTNALIKVNSLVATNKTLSNVEVTVVINTNSGGTGTSYNIAYKIVVPISSSLQILEKGSGFFLMENTSLLVSAGAAGAVDFVISYETLT